MEAFAELNEAGDRIEVVFPYDPAAVKAVKSVPGARFIPRDKGGPKWQLPLDLTSARMLREAFGAGLELGEAVKRWGRTAVRREANLTELSRQDDAQLERLPNVLPELSEWLRPYQRADVAFLAQAEAINSNQPGLGKTAEIIGSIFEAGTDKGSQLVIAPKTSLEVVWLAELTKWQKHPVLLTSGNDSKEKREATIAQAVEMNSKDEPFWLVLNPHMVRYERDKTQPKIVEEGHERYPLVPVYPELFEIVWANVILDEYHKMGITNDKAIMHKTVKHLKRDKMLMMSGTPMGGKPIKLFAALKLIDPGKFTSKWRWAEQWLDISEVDGGSTGMHKSIEGLRAGLEESFYKAHAPYLLRRTKLEVLKELPPKQHIFIECPMTDKQRKQYETVAAEAEIKIEEEHLSITGVLAEYMRLKQFSDARHTVRHLASGELKVAPTTDSGKLEMLRSLLEERGITGTDEAEGDEKVVVFSQFSQIVDMLEEWLNQHGIETAKITGNVKERTKLVEEFQTDAGPRVMLMTTGAGGVSINLDRASTVIFMDETWDPDDQEQAEDRVHRVSRMHQVTVYYLRSKDSIEQHIAAITGGKRLTNEQILDLHRKLFKNAA